jgi:hypothetical protein
MVPFHGAPARHGHNLRPPIVSGSWLPGKKSFSTISLHIVIVKRNSNLENISDYYPVPTK